MTLRHLEIFRAVCMKHSMTLAAEQLHMTQPAVSRAVAELEEHYHRKFFDRIGRRLLLTPDGQQLLRDAEQVLGAFETLEVHAGLRTASAELQIGCSPGIRFGFMERWLDLFARRCPDTRVYVTESLTDTLQQRILAGELDLAMTEGFITDDRLLVRPFRKDELLILASPSHPLASRGTVTAAELACFDFVLPDRATDTRKLFDNVTASRGVCIRPIWSGSDMGALVRMARAGRGLTVVSRIWAEEDLKAGTLVSLPADFSMERHYAVVCHRNKNLSAEARAFIAVCTEEAE